jgi:putative ABC transport system permease protein
VGFVIAFRHDYFDEALGHRGTVDILWVKVDHSQNIPQVIRDIDETFANAASETKTESELAASEDKVAQMRVLINGAKFLALLVVLAIGLVAFNTAAMSARERRREMAVMRSLGFTCAVVIAMATAEGLILGLAGGALGCTSAWIGLKLLPHASRSIGMLAYAIAMPSQSIANGIFIAAVIGALSAFVPAVAATGGYISSRLRAV